MNSLDDQIQVFVRVISDENINEYDRCLEIPSRYTLTLLDIPVDTSSTKAFEKKDKIRNSPLQKDYVVQAASRSEIKRFNYKFDYIFYENEHISDIYDALDINLTVHNCIISVGRSDTLIHKYGFVTKTIKNALEHGFSLEIGCCGHTCDKVESFTNGYQAILNWADTYNLLFSLDYFNPRKLRDEINVTTLILTKENLKVCTQLVDIYTISNSAEFLKKVLINENYSRGGDSQAKDFLVQALTKTICFGAKIYLIGNISPIMPFMPISRTILCYIDCVLKNKEKNRSAYIDLLLKEVRRLQKSNTNKEKKYAEVSSQVFLLKDQLSTQGNILNFYKENNAKDPQQDERAAMAELHSENVKFKSEVEETRKEISILKEKFEKLDREKKDLEEKFQKAVNCLTISENRCNEYSEKISDLRNSADITWKNVQRLESELSNYKSKLSDSETIKNQLKERVIDLENQKSSFNFESDSKNLENIYSLDNPETKKIHLAYYEQLVIQNRYTHALQNFYVYGLKECEIGFERLKKEYEENQELMYNNAVEMEGYYIAKIKEIEEDHKKTIDQITVMTNKVAVNEQGLRQEIEKLKKDNAELKIQSEKWNEEKKNYVHQLKNKIKEKIKEQYEIKFNEFSKKLEETKEQKSKIALDKNMISIELNELKEKNNTEKQQLIREKEELIKNIEQLKSLREPVHKKRNNN